jgi:hypothetical protein
LYSDVDYMAMQHTMNWLAERRGGATPLSVLRQISE